MPNLQDSDLEVLFVFIGDKLPKYASDSIRIAAETSGGKITLLGNQDLQSSVPHQYCRFVAIEDFYNPHSFSVASSAISSSHLFRDGFWLKSLERFFVLSAYMNQYQLDEVFHAELDQLLFNVDELVRNLRKTGLKGVFIPSHSDLAVVASIFYCNDASTLDSFLNFPLSGETFPNEMGMLASWSKLNLDVAFMLPTLASELNPDLVSIHHLPETEAGGLVDAAQLGQWVAGIDPKNVPIFSYPRSKFVDEPQGWLLRESQLRQLSMSYNETSHALHCSVGETRFKLYNLHLHSKIHSALFNRNLSVKKLVDLSNLEGSKRFRGTRAIQISYFTSAKLSHILKNPHRIIPEVSRRLNLRMNRRPGSKPFLSGDTFRKIADHVWESQTKNLQPTQVKKGDIIFCEADRFMEFRDMILSKVKVNYTLILGNSDENHYASFQSEFSELSVSKIYAQNIGDEIQGVTPLPIGLENRWRANHGKISMFRKMNTDVNKKTFRIMSAFSIGTNREVRGLAHDILSENPIVDSMGMMAPRKHRKAIARYAFIACPPGNGLDTHRTWESMYRGSIPIVLDSYMNRYFKSLGLPILIVDSYSDLDNFTVAQLKELYLLELPNFESPALWFDFWEKHIESPLD